MSVLGNIDLSVVVPAYRSWSTLPAVLDALGPQLEGGRREVVLVESSGELESEEIRRRWPWLRLVSPPERTLPGRARNIGISAARGAAIAFIDADAVPKPGWLDELDRALVPGVDAVAGAVLNGTPRSAVGTATYLLEFADWMPERRGWVQHGAACNLLVRRDVLERTGGFHEDAWTGEDTVLTFPLGARRRLAFAPAARVVHLNRTNLVDFMRLQRRLGWAFGLVCASVDFPHRWVGRPALAPVALAFRLAALGRRLLPHRRELATALLLSPLLVAGSLAWAVGLARYRHRAN